LCGGAAFQINRLTDKTQLADQTLNTDGCPPTEIIPLPVRHVDAFNGAITTFEVERLRLRTAADHTLHIEVVRIAIGMTTDRRRISTSLPRAATLMA